MLLNRAVQLLALVILASSGTVVRAQTIKIKLVNGKNGRPVARACVNTWVGTDQKAAMAIPTDKNGVAWLYLTDQDADVNTRNQAKNCGLFGVVHPVVKRADAIWINAGYVVCQSQAGDYSWLARMEFSTTQILRQGTVTANICGKFTASPVPGQLVIFVRPLSLWEKMKE